MPHLCSPKYTNLLAPRTGCGPGGKHAFYDNKKYLVVIALLVSAITSHAQSTNPIDSFFQEDQATTFVGRYAGLNVFEYDGVYVTGDSSGNDVVQDMIAPESAILASSSASGAIVYGAISIVEDTGVEIYAARRVAHSWSDKDNSLWTQRVSSRYCPAPADTATWQTYTVIG
jgi:Phage major capsid protein E.